MQHLTTYHLNPPIRIGFLYYGLRLWLVFFFWNLHLPLNSVGNCTCTCEILLSVGLSFCFWPLGDVSRVPSEPLMRSLFLHMPLLHSRVLSCWTPHPAAFPPSAPWWTAAHCGCRRAGRGRAPAGACACSGALGAHSRVPTALRSLSVLVPGSLPALLATWEGREWVLRNPFVFSVWSNQICFLWDFFFPYRLQTHDNRSLNSESFHLNSQEKLLLIDKIFVTTDIPDSELNITFLKQDL